MKKSKSIIVATLSLLLGGAGYYFYTGSSKAPTCMLDLLKLPPPYPNYVVIPTYHPGETTGAAAFVLVKKKAVDRINTFLTSKGDSCWERFGGQAYLVTQKDSITGKKDSVATIRAYDPALVGATFSSTNRLSKYNYTKKDLFTLYGDSTISNTLLTDEVALTHCAKMQQVNKTPIYVSAANYYWEHPIQMAKVTRDGINQHFWSCYGADFHPINCDGFLRMPRSQKESQDKEARNSTIFKGGTFWMQGHSAIRMGGGFQCLVENILVDRADTAVIYLHCMSSGINFLNIRRCLGGALAGNSGDFIPDTINGRIRGANSLGGSNGCSFTNFHSYPMAGQLFLAAACGSDGFKAINMSQDGATIPIHSIVTIDTRNLSVVKDGLFDGYHKETITDATGADLIVMGGGQCQIEVAHGFPQTNGTGAIVKCYGGTNGTRLVMYSYGFVPNPVKLWFIGNVSLVTYSVFGTVQIPNIQYLTGEGGSAPPASKVKHYIKI